MKKFIFALVFTSMVAAGSARAATYGFSFSAPDTTYGTITGAGTFTAITTNATGIFQITGITGTLDLGATPFAITALLAQGAYASNDNFLAEPAGPFPATVNSISTFWQSGTPNAFFDLDGVSFVADSMDFNIFYGVLSSSTVSSPPPAYYVGYGALVSGVPTKEDVSTNISTVLTPEPNSLVLLSTGMMGLCGLVLMRRRRCAATDHRLS